MKTNSEFVDFDLTQFHQVFFEEAEENLEQFEQILINLNLSEITNDELNAIFRCIHSIKGGAATFSFTQIADLTHELETLLDKLRRHEIIFTEKCLNILLETGDLVKNLLEQQKSGNLENEINIKNLVLKISQLINKKNKENQQNLEFKTNEKKMKNRDLILKIDFSDNLKNEEIDKIVKNIFELFQDMSELGFLENLPCDKNNLKIFRLKTPCENEELLDLLSFHVNKEQIKISDFIEKSKKIENKLIGEKTSIRVETKKVDQLINLVGELVITRSMLQQNNNNLDYENLTNNLITLERNIRSLQESIMSIRMLPLTTVFSRFPRLVRDLSVSMNKKVQLIIQGENTEIDKGIVEKIIDPLTHLIRNSLDHGLENPEERIKAGKDEIGKIILSASHQGGSILIEIKDDGRGLSREKIFQKAKESGFNLNKNISDSELWQFIFQPGFSTASKITEVSGRGVGMDVVKRNINELNGNIQITTKEGQGTTISINLPLTLAILDGMSVKVGDEIYILPLSAMVQSIPLNSFEINTIAKTTKLIKSRDSFIPLLDLKEVLGIQENERNQNKEKNKIAIILESEGKQIALLVDELLNQHQVVIKNLEQNYKKIENVSAATILGDGTVVFILDPDALVRKTFN